jgi:MFS family permease
VASGCLHHPFVGVRSDEKLMRHPGRRHHRLDAAVVTDGGPPVSHPEPAADRPATFREVLASREYRAIFGASGLSWLGDSMARAAVTALVYKQTGSVLASGATFAISYLPWLGIGPVLSALAERYPYRRVMVTCDLARMVTMGLVAIPKMPLPAMIGLLFLTALLNPPFEAARSALLPRVLDGDRYVVALAMHTTTAQAALIIGYFSGGALATFNANLTLLFNAATFGISAFLVGLGVHAREPALRRDQRTHLLGETAAGFKLVFGTPVLRAIALLVFCSLLFTVVPEGIAAGWAGQLTGPGHDRGVFQGVIMMANPIGFVLGGLLIGRLVAPRLRQRLIRPFALIPAAALALAVTRPTIVGVAVISAVCGFAGAAFLPATNGLFVRALPNAFRARAFGVMSSGTYLLQGVAVFATGALADHFSHNVARVVGYWGLGGLVLMTAVVLTWPKADRMRRAIDEAQRANAEAEAPAVPGARTRPDSPSPNGYSPKHAATRDGGPESSSLSAANA